MNKLGYFRLVLITITSLILTSCSSALQRQSLQESSQLIVELQETPSIGGRSDRQLEAVQKVVSNRIKSLGINQAVVEIKGKNSIFVKLPGVKDPTQAIRVLSSNAQLEFQKQKRGTETQFLAYSASRSELKTKLEELQTSKDTAAIAKNQAAKQKNNQALSELFESTNPPLTAAYIKDAYGEPRESKQSNWNVAIRFDKQGEDLFGTLTKETAGTGRAIGIFIDKELISAPTVGPEFAATGITGGAAVITGRFSATEANDLAVQLRSGALPVPVKVKVVSNS